ncbi:PIN domain-containing protein [Fusobacterium periodonticum]|uniref:PIN domain-containing protein n=1 Tax=Fusobacterium periodonticum ATCC 33693 TaxID=546275 RepID=D4CS82_9FUSO|nr:PIN domain-containing protein [Fusobacterium periodonticum]EFE87794.1 hypothetical protein FUSPEROL_00240 [Fusobacterium periodonticum ATCC 33693]
MNFTEIILSYPCIKYRAEVSHFTSRKSTAIEWVILEAINKCEKFPDYSGISIANFFEKLFTISDADLLIRPVLISLQDIGAIIISGIDDETELNTVAMNNLRLTPTGRKMQSLGLLPGVSSQEIFSIYYDLVEGVLKEEINLYKKKSTGISIIDNPNEHKFPEGTIREWFSKIQNNKKQSKFNWLTPTTKIETIYPLDSELYWKNITKKVELVDGMKWKISGMEDQNIDEISLKKFDIPYPNELKNLPHIEIKNPDVEIEKLVSIDEINNLIGEFIKKDDLFCVEAKYYQDVKINQPNKKNIRIGIVFGADKFEVKKSKMQLIICIPDCELNNQGLYFNTSNSVKACITTVSAGEVSKDIAIAYIPKEYKNNLSNAIVTTVDKYYTQNNIILFALYEIGLKDLFLEYVTNIVSENKKLDDKAKIIESFNQKSKEFYGKNLISATDKENFLIDKDYIIEHSKNIETAKKIINDYAEINIFKQDDTLFQKMLQIVIEHVGVQDSLEDIWSFWKVIASTKKAHINWITKMELQKYLYSEKSILNFFNRFKAENLFEIDKYTIVEKTILNLKRISLQVEKLIPELNLYQTVSNEKYNETVLAHKNILKELYEEVRQWKKEEEEFINKVFNLDEFLKTDNPFMNVKNNIDGLRNALATFFDDSFMKFSKVYIVDTCTLLNEPNLISWFDGKKTLLVIPMIVLDELDGLKNSEDEEIAKKAREIIRNISKYSNCDWLNIKESSYPELISKDLDKERNDNKILSIAIKYCTKKPILLTDDTNFGNIAIANNIETMNLESYLTTKQEEKTANKDNKKKNKKKKK